MENRIICEKCKKQESDFAFATLNYCHICKDVIIYGYKYCNLCSLKTGYCVNCGMGGPETRPETEDPVIETEIPVTETPARLGVMALLKEWFASFI